LSAVCGVHWQLAFFKSIRIGIMPRISFMKVGRGDIGNRKGKFQIWI